jgi:phosphatidylserine/phosphatidylglycerophosphate/cardiolipin synthase-like enzyme
LRQTLIAIVTLIVVALFIYYYFTGSDPLGLFTEPEAPATAAPQMVEVAPPAVSGIGEWWHVYFTDPDPDSDTLDVTGTVAEDLIRYIDDAQQSIYVASFEFNITPVAEALIAAHQRGVDVRWVTDDEHGIEADEEDEHGQFAMLEDAGIEVRDDDRGALMHNKFWVFDGQIVWTGSTNITVNGVSRNNNNVVVIHLPEVAAIYEREFFEMWAGEFGPTSTSTVNRQELVVNGVPVQILFAAEDDVAARLTELVEEARRSIRFMAFSFTLDEIGTAVLARANAGVDVRGIFETRSSETEYSEMPALFCAGLPVRQDGNPRTFHHKVFIIDEQVLVTGSFNFSDNADSSNDENVIIITSTELASEYLEEFERRWAEASDPDPADVNCP